MDGENPPIESKGYTINWDEIDENTDPFTSKPKVAPQTVPQLPDNPNEVDLKTPIQRNNSNFQYEESVVSARDTSNTSEANSLLDPTNLNVSYDLTKSQVKIPKSDFALTDSVSVPGVSNVILTNGHTDQESLQMQNKDLHKRVDELTFALLEYQRSLQYMLDQKEKVETKSNDPIAQIISERDQAVKELATLEKAFTELYGRFDRAKIIIDNYKENEKQLQESLQKMHDWLHKKEEKYNDLQKNCTEEITKMSEKSQMHRQKYESELALLQANVRMSELKIKNLETDLASQRQTTAELTTICDDLLNRYNPEDEK